MIFDVITTFLQKIKDFFCCATVFGAVWSSEDDLETQF